MYTLCTFFPPQKHLFDSFIFGKCFVVIWKLVWSVSLYDKHMMENDYYSWPNAVRYYVSREKCRPGFGGYLKMLKSWPDTHNSPSEMANHNLSSNKCYI